MRKEWVMGFEGFKVLIVDDALWPAITLEVALLTLPHVRVVHAGSGLEAWNVLAERPVAAIITDLNMPGMDGFELIELVRTTAATARIPIIVVSADSDPESQARARQLGADAFFVKPYSPAAVRERLEELLHAAYSHHPV
jgi:CheY-like chemotaxis protein